jgi:hypothetical protein
VMRATCVMGSIRIDRRAHASFDASFLSRRLPRAATVVRARSSRRSVRDLWRVSFNVTAGGRSGRLEKSVSRFFSRKRIDPRGTDRSRRPPAQSADGSRHSSARAATAAHTERSRLFGEREARPHTPTDAWGLRIDRRAHASRRLPRAATMVRARSSPRHRLFRHIATHVRQALPSRRRVVSRLETRRRRVSSSIALVTTNPRPRCARLVPRRAASRPASTDLPRLVPIVARFASHRRRTTPSSLRRSRRSTRSARTCLSFSRTTSSSNGTSAWAKAGSAPPTEPSGEVRRPHARRPHVAFFRSRLRNTKKRTPNPIRESRTFPPL